MKTVMSLQEQLVEFVQAFNELAPEQHTIKHDIELEKVMDDYATFVTNKANEEEWHRMMKDPSHTFTQLVEEARVKSARCVTIMEKYRAWKLLEGQEGKTDYFQNIESCIEEEFGSFHVTADSKVLLVGSGSFPMTPLLIAKRTGAKVMGIDIDEEAIEIGRRVVHQLGKDLPIQLEKVVIEEIPGIHEITHVIFSSTVNGKYDLLDQLHTLTNDDVVVAMRYGNELKSLFNYPMQQVNERKWKMVDTVLRPHQVFDIALYKKA
ncbi:class I SAM-dependent methyltransferase [Metabacillus iocasae]|uniref:Ribosomal protein L11 methylase PrmA n=1 Tax=Priestia iocasae TaxID=2291674 RepID=A0ABS2QSJ9_9BACI|nr:class I SAM-dependent methyltransferase [Metabacillus iocasae]MBM7702365.1 ribosomal protein L11 methylase PrmA [Metabacillus iocasae]